MKLLATTKCGNFPVKIYESTDTKSYQAYGITAKSEDANEIYVMLDPDMTPDLYWETYWHELVHVFEKSYGHELSHELVNVLGMGLAHMMRDMKWKGKPAAALPAGLEVVKQLRKRPRRKKK